jgi:hypothetical protein
MSYIQCPNCGQKALSVATRCPRCQTPFVDSSGRGSSSPRPRRIPPALIVGVAVVILIIVGAIERELGLTVGTAPAPMPSPSPAPPAVAAESPAVAPAPATSEPLRPAAADSVATPVSSAPAPTPSPTPSPLVGSSSAPPPPPPTGSETGKRRYASTWVNVRAGPNGRAPIVRVLKPGESVLVDSLQQGWYQVLADGGPGGYVDGSLVDSSRPSPSHTP